jgi:hypothetical protein
MQHQFKLVFLLLLGTLPLGCLPKHESDFKEAPGVGDDPRLIGGSANTSWDILQNDTGAEVKIPWTDTYWPLMKMSLANRWMISKTKGSITYAPVIPSIQVTEMMTAFRDKNSNALAELSPGEKYDLIKNSGEFSSQLIETLKGEAAVLDLPTLQNLKINLESATDKLSRIEDTYEFIRKLITKYAGELQVQGRKWRSLLREAAGGSAQAKAAADKARVEFQRIYQMMAQAQKRSNDIRENEWGQIWFEHYDAKKALKAAIKPKISLFQASAQRISKESLLLGDGWQSWANFFGQFENDDWGWMGHCHGWAPAAVYEEAPKHAVMVNVKGSDILFTEGDIRGLLSKTWADQLPEDKFSGNRCNAEKLEFDKWGRVVDGAVCSGAQSSCSLKSGGAQMVITSSKLAQGLIVFSDNPEASESHVGIVTSSLGRDTYQLSVYKSLLDYQNFVRTGDASKAKPMTAQIYPGCRDTNPMTLHLGLYEQIKNKKRGLVFDKTKTAQVWNQPVFKYQITHLSITKKDGTLSVPREPVAIQDVDDAFAKYRAPGTRYLVQVQNAVSYGLENGPRYHYEPADESVGTDTYSYTLELDANKKVIGGEWGVIPSATNFKEEQAETLIRMELPDFLWMVPKGNIPSVGSIDYALVKKLHQCSLQSAGLKSMNLEGKGNIQYTDCKI